MKRSTIKTITVLLVLCIFLISSFGSTIIIVSFKINQTSIAKTLCVQRNVKHNSCCGRCQLKKRLEESEKQEIPLRLCEKFSFLVYTVNEIGYTLSFPSASKEQKYMLFNQMLCTTNSKEHFHPPCCS